MPKAVISPPSCGKRRHSQNNRHSFLISSLAAALARQARKTPEQLTANFVVAGTQSDITNRDNADQLALPIQHRQRRIL